jgi:hypothetical protein
LSTFKTIQDLVKVNIGGRDDVDATLILKAAINYAYHLAAVIFKPRELRTQSSITFMGGAGGHSLASLNWLSIDSIWNETDSLHLRFIPYDLLDSLLPSLTVTKYYSIYGDTLYLRASPAGSKILTMNHLITPTSLTNDSDALSFTDYDSFIVALATGLTFAGFEEGEAAMLWQKATDFISQPLILSGKESEIIAKQQIYFDVALQQAKEKK